MSSCGYDDHVVIDESKRDATLNKFLGMNWKKNLSRKMSSKKNIEELSDAAASYHGGNDLDRRIRNVNKSSKFRFEVLIRETYPYIDEVPDSEVLNDCDSDDDCQPKKEKPVKHFERTLFFKNIQPTDECAFRFYAPGFIKKKEDSSHSVMKQKELNYSEAFRKPWLSLLKSDSLNSQIPSINSHCNEGNKAESSVECIDTILLHSQAVAEELIPRRKPGAGTRLKCKSLAVPPDESEQVKHEIFTDNCKHFLGDIEMVLNHIDAERLSNVERKTYTEKDAVVNEFQEQLLSNENPNKMYDPPEIDVTNTALVNGEFCEKQNDICFPSSTICNTPTARVQPSVMINERHISSNHQHMRAPNNCLNINETQIIVPKSKSPAFGTDYQIIQNNNDVSHAPVFEEKQTSNNNSSILGMTDCFSAPASYPWQDDPATQPITSTCLTQAISAAANQLLSCAPLNAQNQVFESHLPVNTCRNTVVENVNRAPMFSNNPGQSDWTSQTPHMNQMPSYVPEMALQQNQISQYPVPIGSHETLKNFNQIAMHSNIRMQN